MMGMARDRDRDDAMVLKASLRGITEVPPVSTLGTASFVGTLSADKTTINFTLTFSNLNALPIQSHIHFGLKKEAAGVMVFLCGPAGSPAKQACPAATSGTVTGTITAADVIGPVAQGISAGELAKVLQVIDEGASYVNLHTVQSPAGEIRGQVSVGDDDDRRRER